MQQRKYLRALTIAGFDGSGGAGIQADLKAFSALGCYGMTVLTALPVQNTMGVSAIYPIPEKCVAEQLKAIMDDVGVDAIKMGMLHRQEIMQVVVDTLKAYSAIKIVVDPVMVAKSGHLLLEQEAIEFLKKRLFPLASVITPNLMEASALLKRPISNRGDMECACRDLLKMGPKAVLVKGGHLEGAICEDCLILADENIPHWFTASRIDTPNTHGTGCTLSSAIAAYLAHGNNIFDSVNLAKVYISKSLEAGSHYELGHGHGPVHHFFAFWK